MKFNEHLNLRGKHALLGPSTYSWINYDEDKLLQFLSRKNRTILGTALHSYACSKIKLHQKARKNKKQLKDEIKLHMINEREPFTGKLLYSMENINSVDTLPDEVFDTLITYINGAIEFKMSPETVLYYSDHFFGTCDALSFENGMLRVHDLKTGANPAHMEQLIIYAALFCLEYRLKPGEIKIELRLYQNNEVIFFRPTPEDIVPVMDKIVTFDSLMTSINTQEE